MRTVGIILDDEDESPSPVKHPPKRKKANLVKRLHRGFREEWKNIQQLAAYDDYTRRMKEFEGLNFVRLPPIKHPDAENTKSDGVGVLESASQNRPAALIPPVSSPLKMGPKELPKGMRDVPTRQNESTEQKKNMSETKVKPTEGTADPGTPSHSSSLEKKISFEELLEIVEASRSRTNIQWERSVFPQLRARDCSKQECQYWKKFYYNDKQRSAQDVNDSLSLTNGRRERRLSKGSIIWKRSSIFEGPRSLSLFNACGHIFVDDFVLQTVEMAALDQAKMNNIVPKVLPCLPEVQSSNLNRKTLVLDMDETLVHCDQQLGEGVTYDHMMMVDYMGMKKKIGVKKRPFVEEFLAWCSDHFEVAIFTSDAKPYSEQMVKLLDPTGEYVKYCLCEDQCSIYDECTFIKNLAYLSRDLSKTVIIDNSPVMFACQLDNGIPIQSFHGEKEDSSDDELLKIKDFLQQVLEAEDVRTLIRQKFKMRAFLDNVRDAAAAMDA